MTGIYFSGTGNTKYCIERLVGGLGNGGAVYSIEDENVREAVGNASEIVFGYPVYYSSLPKIVFDFIAENAALWKGKKIFVLATMGLFSGDGAGCAARQLKKCGAVITGGLHVKMPDCIGDVKLLKRTKEKNRKLIAAAEQKIDRAVLKIRNKKYPRDGLGFFDRAAGLFGQRLYFRGKTERFYAGVKADKNKCVACGLCVSLCPMGNIAVKEGAARFGDRCTVCYRCFAHCPAQAITVLGKRVYEQYKREI